ncbi:MAG: sigma 54-dependent Fis family transcriptional regulator [bacterium]|nr:sigma 54-dependent Fis family transcriptional regulator [bacterium]
MLYLLYLRNGFIKKFPLDKKEILLGRGKTCDFFIDESIISKEHARITVYEDGIELRDLGSTNGLFTKSGEVREARLKVNQWFRIGFLKFFLKEGNASEFVLSDKVRPYFNRISKAIQWDGEQTNLSINLLYTESLVEMLQIGFSLQSCGNLFDYADNLLKTTLKKGRLLLVSKKERVCRIESQWGAEETADSTIVNDIVKIKDLFRTEIKNANYDNNHHFCSFPVPLKNQSMVLIYVNTGLASDGVVDFLEVLAVEISVIHSLIEHNESLMKKGSGGGDEKIPEIITANPDMLNLLSRSKKIAVSNLYVLIEGETGTGKELLAQFIHANSKRNMGAFIALNCAAIPENLMEVELFGHEKGAFTDASGQRKGKLELASGGTLVLDEIGDMPLNLQAKLLRTIQEEQFYRVGGNEPIKVDLRVICMTNKNVKGLMQQKLFREDLYYRIAHVSLKIPPLRARQEDIVPLIDHFTNLASKNIGIVIKGFSSNAIRALEVFGWPGNVRELENEVIKILNLSENEDIIDTDMLKEEINEAHGGFASELPAIIPPESERNHLLMLLERYKWNKTQVAKELNYSRTTLYEKLKKYGII